ncbi:phosphohydrolase [Pyruvatibacter mobilis]|uniref:phosphohydrolase n=1 Tax=Pyruvatibacter mobilis TaxID=1712261 RepID=UPI003BAF6E87
MNTEERAGDWIQTASGRAFWPLDPRPEDVCIEDIAHALAHQCRFSGHCRSFYSVAQHSVLVSRQCAEENRLWGLLHDAAEAYVCDVPRPLKPLLFGYKAIEDKVAAVVADRFGLPREMPEEIKRIDSAILADEAAQIMAAPPRSWHLPEPPLGVAIHPVSASSAKQMFLQEFFELAGVAKEAAE